MNWSIVESIGFCEVVSEHFLLGLWMIRIIFRWSVAISSQLILGTNDLGRVLLLTHHLQLFAYFRIPDILFGLSKLEAHFTELR